MSNPSPVIVWFRDDLRLDDQPALHGACAGGAPVLCVYVHDEESADLRREGGAARWWRAHSLARLARELAAIGGRLDIFRGAAAQVIPALAAGARASAAHWCRRYGAAEIAVDSQVKTILTQAGVKAASFNGALLVEPWEVRNKTGGEFKVFTPFWKAALAQGPFADPLPAPARILAAPLPETGPRPVALDDLGLSPTKPDWSGGLAAEWTPGEAGARARLTAFLDHGIGNYGEDRNRPDLAHVSRLSPHLRHGEISPRRVFHAVEEARDRGEADARDVAKFVSELGWREFSHHLLYHWPDLATRNFSRRFDAFPWETPPRGHWRAWTRGRTGYPIVDAGMRELWTTGYMHNRVRMIAASFLTKHLMVDWREGEAWFWDTLCDADAANNPASWQWVAGSGADAAPYFRIFNPVLQGEKFDPDGDYVRRHVPELAGLPARFIHRPWDAPPIVLKEAGVKLGASYPHAIVDHGLARERALEAFSRLSERDSAAIA